MTLSPPQRQQLGPVLDDLGAAVEDVVRTGLTAATAATVERLTHAANEVTRLGLGRLAASVRFATEEIGRYLKGSDEFSARRLTLFLNRSWVVARGLKRAIATHDEALLARLLGGAVAPVVAPSLDAVVLGVERRVSRTSGSFQFRMRQIGGDGDGRALSWSFVFAKKASELPGEAWLHLPQPQKFEPKLLLGASLFTFTQVAVGADGRLQLSPKATVTAGAAFRGFDALLPAWDPAATAARLRAHTPTPLDLEVELAEEIVLRDWTVGDPTDRGDGHHTFPVEAHGHTLFASVRADAEGKPLADALKSHRKGKKRPPLFGLLHGELCRLQLQPLAVLERGAMRHLTVAGGTIDKKQLLALLNL